MPSAIRCAARTRLASAAVDSGSAGRSRWAALTRCLWVAVLLQIATGCAGTRWPRLRPSSAEAERQESELYYPYGESEAGPALQAQPRGYDLPRSEAIRVQRTSPGAAYLGQP